MGFNCLKASATSRRQFSFYHIVPRYSWYSFYQPQKEERLSRPWSHPVVLNTGPLDWKFSALTTWTLLPLTFHWIHHEMPCFIALLMTILMLIGTVLVIIWEIFYGRISLNSVLLLLLVNFVSGFRLEMMYISLIKSIRSSFTHLHGFLLLVRCCHSS